MPSLPERNQLICPNSYMVCKHPSKRGYCKNYVKTGAEFCYKHAKPIEHIKKPGQPVDLSIHTGMAKRYANLMTNHVLNREMYNKVMDGYDGYSLKDMATFYGPLIFASMCELALNGKSEETRIKAGAFVSERIYGKQVQPISIEGNITHSLGVIMIPQVKTLQTNEIIELDEHGCIVGVETKDVK